MSRGLRIVRILIWILLTFTSFQDGDDCGKNTDEHDTEKSVSEQNEEDAYVHVE